MKKSEIYHKAAQAVMIDKLLGLTFAERLAIIKKLIEDEEVALFVESCDEEKEAAV